MPGWQNSLSAHLARFVKPRENATGSGLEDIRRRYDEIALRHGTVPDGLVVEAAQLGQVKGEWLRFQESQSSRLIIYLHGGGYVSGSPESHRPLAAHLCKASGAAGLVLDYRLGPEFPFPSALRDVVDAYRFLVGKGVPANSIVFAGDGSGGGLAFAAVLAARNAGLPAPAACVAMSPWADLSLSGWSILENAAKDQVLNWELLFVSARHCLKGGNPADPYASPVFGSFRDFPPIMVHAGSHEILRDDAGRLGEQAAAANVPVSVEIYDGMQHVFQAQFATSEAKVSLGRLGQFIRSRTADDSAMRGVAVQTAAYGG
jgi:monoterpene epsilon-lactone hydrolase